MFRRLLPGRQGRRFIPPSGRRWEIDGSRNDSASDSHTSVSDHDHSYQSAVNDSLSNTAPISRYEQLRILAAGSDSFEREVNQLVSRAIRRQGELYRAASSAARSSSTAASSGSSAFTASSRRRRRSVWDSYGMSDNSENTPPPAYSAYSSFASQGSPHYLPPELPASIVTSGSPTGGSTSITNNEQYHPAPSRYIFELADTSRRTADSTSIHAHELDAIGTARDSWFLSSRFSLHPPGPLTARLMPAFASSGTSPLTSMSIPSEPPSLPVQRGHYQVPSTHTAHSHSSIDPSEYALGGRLHYSNDANRMPSHPAQRWLQMSTGSDSPFAPPKFIRPFSSTYTDPSRDHIIPSRYLWYEKPYYAGPYKGQSHAAQGSSIGPDPSTKSPRAISPPGTNCESRDTLQSPDESESSASSIAQVKPSPNENDSSAADTETSSETSPPSSVSSTLSSHSSFNEDDSVSNSDSPSCEYDGHNRSSPISLSVSSKPDLASSRDPAVTIIISASVLSSLVKSLSSLCSSLEEAAQSRPSRGVASPMSIEPEVHELASPSPDDAHSYGEGEEDREPSDDVGTEWSLEILSDSIRLIEESLSSLRTLSSVSI